MGKEYNILVVLIVIISFFMGALAHKIYYETKANQKVIKEDIKQLKECCKPYCPAPY